MGTYLAHPITEKESSDTDGQTLTCGASSMQGWRATQEDAHNCILHFDTDASLFAVYDGHGGKEVAVYTAQKLPDFIKETESYKAGDYEAALKEAFIKFDATLKEPDVITILKDIAGRKDDECDETKSECEEEIGNLHEEAQMPLEQVMAKYTLGEACKSNVTKLKVEDKKDSTPISPFLRARRAKNEIRHPDCGSSSKLDDSHCEVTSLITADTKPKINGDLTTTKNNSNTASPKKSDVDASEEKEEPQPKNDVLVDQTTPPDSCSESDSTQDKVTPENAGEVDGKKEVLMNGVGVHAEDAPNKQGPLENGDVENKIEDKVENKTKGKGKQLLKRTPKTFEKKTDQTPDQLFKTFMQADAAEVCSESDSEDASFRGSESTSDENVEEVDAVSGVEAEAEPGEVEEEEEEEEEEDDDEDADDEECEDESDSEEIDDDDDCEAFCMGMTDVLKQYLRVQNGESNAESQLGSELLIPDEDESDRDDEYGSTFLLRALTRRRPGSDSGCTAVVALIKDNKLYVANAGDSRCVVSKDGTAIEMSFDHKPEDVPEMARIEKAGGKVTSDGRVNGGLNLSRAIGDHVYKQVTHLPVEEQMISPLPDIKVLDMDPDLEFIVLACDGIWNFMTSKEVVDFVRSRLMDDVDKVSTICEELFDHCLAPNTLGDGTGCDNMTAVIIKLKNSNLFKDKLKDGETEARKRRASQDTIETDSKKQKTDLEEKQSFLEEQRQTESPTDQ